MMNFELRATPLSKILDYKLGNRSALEWVIDQYRVSEDDDGNIVRLLGQVITVSLETMQILKNLPATNINDHTACR
jgi:predicted helicase